jgi:ParB-like chromosome segregation protein Spo0J
MKIENIKIELLENNKGQITGVPKNPRLIKDEKFKSLVKSIQDDPEMLELRECLVYKLNKKYGILGGNQRFCACKELGYTEVPCKVIPPEITPAKLRAIIIKDNIPSGEMDFGIIAEDWDSVELKEWGMELQEKFSGDIDVFFTAGNGKEKKPKTMKCPHCGEEINL